MKKVISGISVFVSLITMAEAQAQGPLPLPIDSRCDEVFSQMRIDLARKLAVLGSEAMLDPASKPKLDHAMGGAGQVEGHFKACKAAETASFEAKVRGDEPGAARAAGIAEGAIRNMHIVAKAVLDMPVRPSPVDKLVDGTINVALGGVRASLEEVPLLGKNLRVKGMVEGGIRDIFAQSVPCRTTLKKGFPSSCVSDLPKFGLGFKNNVQGEINRLKPLTAPFFAKIEALKVEKGGIKKTLDDLNKQIPYTQGAAANVLAAINGINPWIGYHFWLSSVFNYFRLHTQAQALYQKALDLTAQRDRMARDYEGLTRKVDQMKAGAAGLIARDRAIDAEVARLIDAIVQAR